MSEDKIIFSRNHTKLLGLYKIIKSTEDCYEKLLKDGLITDYKINIDVDNLSMDVSFNPNRSIEYIPINFIIDEEGMKYSGVK